MKRNKFKCDRESPLIQCDRCLEEHASWPYSLLAHCPQVELYRESRLCPRIKNSYSNLALFNRRGLTMSALVLILLTHQSQTRSKVLLGRQSRLGDFLVIDVDSRGDRVGVAAAFLRSMRALRRCHQSRFRSHHRICCHCSH